jgi:hypothetical protein
LRSRPGYPGAARLPIIAATCAAKLLITQREITISRLANLIHHTVIQLMAKQLIPFLN